MKITVTAEDIAIGRRCDPELCPVGHALRRAGVPYESVMGSALLVAESGDRLNFLPLPPAVARWILEFDRNRPVEPFSFELSLAGQAQDCPPLAA